MRSFSTACAQLRARDESSKRSFCRLRRFPLHSFAQLDVTTWFFTLLFLFFSLQRKRALAEISQILGSDIFFCVERLEFTISECAWTIHESVTRTNIYSSARAEPMVIPNSSSVKTTRDIDLTRRVRLPVPRLSIHGYESPGKRRRVLLNTVD